MQHRLKLTKAIAARIHDFFVQMKLIRRSRKFCRGWGGVKFDNVFLLDEGIEDPNTTKKMPSSARQRAFRWRADDGQTLNTGLVAVIFQGIRTSIAKKPYIIPVL